MKITIKSLRKKGACFSGRLVFNRVFPRGVSEDEYTLKNAMKVIEQVPTSYLHWFLWNYINAKVADRFLVVVNNSDARISTYDSVDKENKHVARWLLRTMKKYYLEGGDAKTK